MRILIALTLIAGGLGWAVLAPDRAPEVSVASNFPRQISQLSR